MKKYRILSAFSVAAFISTGFAQADVCDYKPSKLAGEAVSATVATAGGAAAATGAGLKVAGYYTLVHAGSGLTMLGSTAAGASAAGTAGILAGTGGAIGSAGAILMAPVTIVVGAVTAVGVGAYEGYCYFQVERVTEPDMIREILENIAANDPSIAVRDLTKGLVFQIETDDERKEYKIKNLYIADGELMHRDWFLNTNLGPVVYVNHGEGLK
jgi:hypothetical protein